MFYIFFFWEAKYFWGWESGGRVVRGGRNELSDCLFKKLYIRSSFVGQCTGFKYTRIYSFQGH